MRIEGHLVYLPEVFMELGCLDTRVTEIVEDDFATGSRRGYEVARISFRPGNVGNINRVCLARSTGS